MVKRVKVLTNAMLEAAIDNDMLIKNPARKIDIPPLPEVKKERKAFTEVQEIAIIDFMPQ
jgi:hypothetical protein